MRSRKNIRKNLPVKNKTRGRSITSSILIMLPVFLGVFALYIIAHTFRSTFVVHRIVFTGNEHMTDEELRTLAGVKFSDNLLALSGKTVFSNMMKSPWLRSVSIRKELPDGLHILLTEAEPFALLDMKGRLFIVDDKGKMLEELRDSQVPFLPIIAGDPFTRKDSFSESISLVRAIRKTGFMARKDHIEIIAGKPEELAMNIDGTVVKIGAGEHESKLGRLTELEEEIKKRQIPVDYIDLRFSNKVVVKPINEVIR